MFINGVLFNSEVWHGLKTADLALLSNVDKEILRYICKAHAKTPTEFLYLETSSLPLNFIVSSRRMLYLHTILDRDNSELLKRVYMAQKEQPTNGDFCELVKEDFKTIGEDLNEIDILAMGKYNYKKLIKTKVKQAALKALQEIQASHSKVNQIKYEKFEIQSYMTSSVFNNEEISQLLALRSHTVRGIKKNFSSWYKPNLSCLFTCSAEDSQPHLLSCKPILDLLTPQELATTYTVKYDDIYGCLERQKVAVTVFSRLLDIRERLLEAATPASGTSLDAASTPGGNGDL